MVWKGFIYRKFIYYAGNDGNVYRRGDDGWQTREGGDWSNVDAPDRAGTQTADRVGTQAVDRARQTGATTSGGGRSTMDRLQRDQASRTSGRTRTRDYGSYKRGGSSRGAAGSYRSSGGGRRR